MPALCRHRAEKALEVYWQRPITRTESTTLVTALMNPKAASAHVFLMQNLGLRLKEADQIYQSYAPTSCTCDPEASVSAA